MRRRPYQYPIQVGSLTTRPWGDLWKLMRGDNVAGGKFLPAVVRSRLVNRNYRERAREGMTPSQPMRQGKSADRRQTNYVSVVKVTQERSWRLGDCGWATRCSIGEARSSEEEMGKCTQRAHRRKSRRYVLNGHFLRNWGCLDMSVRGKGEYKAESPLKSLLKHIKKSEMTIVALILRVSKALGSEGSLAFSVYCGGRRA